MFRSYSVALVLALAALAYAACAANPLPRIGEEEIKMGKEAAAEAEKDVTILHDAELDSRLRAIGGALAAAANTAQTEASYGSPAITPFSYTFKVVDSKQINAFSLPGGYIYIYKGLIDFCESDHELAAVLAHEITHVSHHHMVHLRKEQSRLDGRLALILLAGLIGDIRPPDMSNVMLGTQFYKTARLNRYGQRAEVDADLAALTYMLNAGYNPVGMLTFLEHLAERPDLIEWGILQTHPYTRDRVAAVKARLLDLGVQINRRAVTTAFTARTRRSETSFEVLVGDRFVCRLTEEAQARMAAERINALLDAGLQIRDIRVSGSAVVARGEAAFEITPDDAALAGKPQEQVAACAADALRHVIFAQMVRDLW